MNRLSKVLIATTVAIASYLAFFPTPLDPVAWTPPPINPNLPTPNAALQYVQRLGVGVGTGPEGVAVDAIGRVYVGYADGRIVQFAPNGGSYVEMSKSRGGRPLGLTFGPRGGVAFADAYKGLNHLGGGIKPKTLLKEAAGKPIHFADDVDNSRFDHWLYLSDASSKYTLDDTILDVLEHRPHGRLIAYEFSTKETKVLKDGLYFANGVAVGPEDEYVLVAETTAYRIQRIWLKGERAGQAEVFIDGLPGFPDNLSYDYDNGLFWVALYGPRSASLDKLANAPAWLKKVVARLPSWVQPKPEVCSWVLGVNTGGKVLHNLKYCGDKAYGPITSVEAQGPWLYFGSLTANSIARLPLNVVIPTAKAPPAGWETAAERPRQYIPPVDEEAIHEANEAEEREENMERIKKGLPPLTREELEAREKAREKAEAEEESEEQR